MSIILYIPLEFYVDEHITLMGAFTERERAEYEGQMKAGPPHPYSLQMAVLSCMRLKDAANSQYCILGKLILQAKSFLFLGGGSEGGKSALFLNRLLHR